MIVNQTAGLTIEQTTLFIEVVDASLRITRPEQFFSWLQGSCQYLIPHEVLICGLQGGPENSMHYEKFISTRYLTDQHFRELTCQDGLLDRVTQSWVRSHRPICLAEGMQPGNFGVYAVPFLERPGFLHEMEVRNVLAHGVSGRDGGVSAFFCFSRLPTQPTATQAYLLELLVPHLHAVLVRVMSGQGAYLIPESSTKSITLREREILHWLHHGKTNWEIASILDISPLTVKNHVQNILRKLNVQNRSHAAVKASQMGLVQL